MKGHMKRQLRAFLLAMLCIVLVIPAMNVSAATQRQKAIAAYKKYLSQSKVYVMPKGKKYYDYSYEERTYNGTASSKAKFSFVNIDNDGVPELVVSAMVSGIPTYTVLTYKNGKINRAYYEFEAGFIGYYPKTGIFLEIGYTDGTPYNENYYKLKGVKAPEVMSKFVYGSRPTEAYYSVGGRDVSIRTFAAKRKSLTGGKSLLKPKVYSNTAANRKLRLK